jgi:NADPH2:quinone reductase
VEYAALNPADRFLAEGRYPAKPLWPHILGRDAVGRVAELGPGVHGLAIGDERLILRCGVGVDRPGTLAERVAVPVESLAPLPAGWTRAEAAGASLVYLTAWQALTQWAPEVFGIVLVAGATGGVGTASIQLARSMGAEVVAVTRSRERVRDLERVGAHHVVVSGNQAGWASQVLDRLDGRRVGLAIDSVAGPGFAEVIRTLGDRGCVSLVGQSAGPVPEFNTGTLFFRRLRIGGVAVGSYTADECTHAWKEITTRLARIGARPIQRFIVPFEDVPAAFEQMAGSHFGKITVAIAPDLAVASSTTSASPPTPHSPDSPSIGPTSS